MTDSERTISLSDRAYRSPFAMVLFLGLVAFGLWADLASKHYVFKDILASRDPVLVERQIEDLQSKAVDQFGRELTSQEALGYLNFSRDVGCRMRFTLSLNPGAVFGIKMHESQGMHRLIVGIATVLTVIIVLMVVANSHKRDFVIHTAMACILAGALGNLYDRLFSCVTIGSLEPIKYHVRDFIDASAVPLPLGFKYIWVFNVADVWLVVGVMLMLIHWIISGIRAKRAL